MGEHLRTLDLLVVLLYMIGMAGVGLYCARRTTTTEGYFLGNRAFPGWAIGLSMLGTSISSVTFLALPAAAYILDYRQAVPNLTLPIVAVVAVVLFIPLFRRGRATSAFEYLEARFGTWARTYAAASFIFLQLVRLSTVLYLVSIPVASMTGVHVLWVVLIGGVFIGFYTVLGGIEAVIWTDVVQTVILLLGGVVCIGAVILSLPGGLAEVVSVGAAHDKFSFGPLEASFDHRTFLALLLLGLVNFTTEYSSNQNVVQRYLAARSTYEARKATLICAAMSVPTWMMFFFLGTCVFVYYQAFPDPRVAEASADQVLPIFILSQIPAGVAGLLIAACLAAAMSSLDSSINSIATVVTTDFVRRFGRRRDETHLFAVARFASVGAGVLMIGGAAIMHVVPRESMNDLMLILGSIFGGGILAIYMIGFFARWIGSRALLAGVVLGVSLNLYLMFNAFELLPAWLHLDVHAYWTTVLVNLTVVTVSILVALVWPNRKPTQGLTVWSLRPDANETRTSPWRAVSSS